MFGIGWPSVVALSSTVSSGRVIVHTGEGRAFQTGVDVAELASDGIGMERYRESMEKWDVHFTAWHEGVTKPVITAVNGICAGGGFHSIVPLSSASMIMRSSQTICHAISAAVRDFGSGR